MPKFPELWYTYTHIHQGQWYTLTHVHKHAVDLHCEVVGYLPLPALINTDPFIRGVLSAVDNNHENHVALSTRELHTGQHWQSLKINSKMALIGTIVFKQ